LEKEERYRPLGTWRRTVEGEERQTTGHMEEDCEGRRKV
jgi:hypothetical protein